MPYGCGSRACSAICQPFLRGISAPHSLQVKQGMMMRFGARKMGTQALVQVVQTYEPAAHGLQGCLDGFGCGMVKKLHAFLAFDGLLDEEVKIRLACHIGARQARSFF